MVGAFAVFTLRPPLTPHMPLPCRKLPHRPAPRSKVQLTICCTPLTECASVAAVAGQSK